MTLRLLFSTIDVTRQVFYRTSLTYAIVNLKPIVSGRKATDPPSDAVSPVLTELRGFSFLPPVDVLVIPTRPVLRMTDLTPPELAALMTGVQEVGRVIEREYAADGLTIACQDGKAAGQSVPHVHFHILPRKLKRDFFENRNDDIYPELERAEGSLPKDYQNQSETGTHQSIKVDAEELRLPRSIEEMEKEASWLASFFGSTN